VCFYTDGLVERRDWILDTGLEYLRSAVDVRPPEAVCARVMSELTTRRQPDDDIAILVMQAIGG
jgi:hypothetical protein